MIVLAPGEDEDFLKALSQAGQLAGIQNEEEEKKKNSPDASIAERICCIGEGVFAMM